MQFKEVIGQKAIIDQLRNITSSGRIPHALLFLGREGTGKLALALAFVQYLLCENKTGGDSCGICSNCQKTKKLIHPDIHISFPVVKAKKDTGISNDYIKEWREAVLSNPYLNYSQWIFSIDKEGKKQGNISAKECNNIIKNLSLKTFEGKRKFQIIWFAEYLKKEGNKLLKIIEEPPENTIVILTAENEGEILPTILSRCQIIKTKPVADEDISAGLQKKFDIEKSKADSVALLADGNFNEAIIISEQQVSEFSELFINWFRKCYLGDSVELVQWGEKLANLSKENQKHFFKYCLHFLREYSKLKFDTGIKVRLQENELKVAQNLTKIISFEQMEKIVELLTICSFHLERNANAKLLFLDAGIKLHNILKSKNR